MSSIPARPRLTLAVVTHNAAEALATRIASAIAWVDEIVVLDRGSTDTTRRLADSQGARVVPLPDGVAESQLHDICRFAATSEWIVWGDATWELDPRWLAEVRAFAFATSDRQAPRARPYDPTSSRWQLLSKSRATTTGRLPPSGTTPLLPPGNVDRPVVGFWHVAQFPGWEALVAEQWFRLRASGLLEVCQCVHVGIVGREPLGAAFSDPQLRVLYHEPDVTWYERRTLAQLHAYCRHTDCDLFYFHTKGISRPNAMVTDWRHLLEYFCFFRSADCREALRDHDICGVNWLTVPSPHFSGNFWWARADFLRQLPPEPTAADGWYDPERTACEAWLGSGPAPRVAELHHSHVNHYHTRYPRRAYARVGEVALPEVPSPTREWPGLNNLFQDLLEPLENIDTVVDVEIGWGTRIFALATALPQATVLGIDTSTATPPLPSPEGSGRSAHDWIRQEAKSYPRIVVLQLPREEAARRVALVIDVLHLDGLPSADQLVHDFQSWVPFVRTGGCVLFHGTVTRAADVGRFFYSLPGRKLHVEQFHGLGAWFKPLDFDAHATAEQAITTGPSVGCPSVPEMDMPL